MTTFITKQPGKSREEAVREAFAAASGAAGFYSRKITEGEERLGYDLVDLASGDSKPLAREKDKAPAGWKGGTDHGHFLFSEEGFAFGEKIVDRALADGVRTIFLDEIGKLELEGGGFAQLLRRLTDAEVALYIGCRKVNIEPLKETFRL